MTAANPLAEIMVLAAQQPPARILEFQKLWDEVWSTRGGLNLNDVHYGLRGIVLMDLAMSVPVATARKNVKKAMANMVTRRA